MEFQDIERLSRVMEDVEGPLTNFRRLCRTFLKQENIFAEEVGIAKDLKKFADDGGAALRLLRRKIKEWRKFNMAVFRMVIRIENGLKYEELNIRLGDLSFSREESQEICATTTGEVVNMGHVAEVLKKIRSARLEKIKSLELEFFSVFRLL